ncbi:MAG: acyltransferase [Clostridiales bacterium]|nr:acyltransferase [Clostridiales bacterium]
MSGKRERILWVDAARCLAILCVVLCHATERIYSFDVDFMAGISTLSNVFAFLCFSVGRLGVPLFLFISGYLLMGREYDTKDCFRFWKRNLLPLLVTTEIWIVLYNIFCAWYYDTPFSVAELLSNMLLFENVNLSHFWYMPMILSVYLFLPLLSNTLQMFDKKVWNVLLGASFVYLCVVPLLNVWLGATTGESLSSSVNFQFLGGYYGLYLILGSYVRRGDFDRVKTWVLWIVGILSFSAVVGIQLLAFHYNYKYKVWYNSAFLMIGALCLFLIVSRFHRFPFLNGIQSLSRHSFAIYLIHAPVRLLVAKCTDIDSVALARPVKVALLFVISLFISWAAGALLSRIPKIGGVLTLERANR